MRIRALPAMLAAVALAAAGCSDDARPAPDPDVAAPDVIAVRSTAFGNGDRIPARFGCDGAGSVPPLTWTRVPARAAALAVVVDDPDAPGGTFVHWVVVDLPASTDRLGPGPLPGGAAVGTNSAGEAAYAPPCPPSGTHHYRFTVYGLSAPTGLPDGTGVEESLAEIRERAVARGRLVGTFAREDG